MQRNYATKITKGTFQNIFSVILFSPDLQNDDVTVTKY